MAEKRNGEVESTQGLVTAEKGGLVPGKLQRRDFGKLLGVHTLLLSTLSLAACGGSGGDDNPSTDPTNPTNPTDPTNPTNPTEPKVYPVATPITDTEAQPVSYTHLTLPTTPYV